ncbi:hypothetical protein GCM10007242_44410 [Pigmentiphaga litoralis]|nr:hypothetical protein GCM10007242_44410 [Pigmentiphaga litoralis]
MLSPDTVTALLSSPPSSLAEKVRATIGKGLISAREVAEACGVSVQAINGWKNNGRIAKEHLRTLAGLTGLPVSWWLPGADAEDAPATGAAGMKWPFESISASDVSAMPPALRLKLDGAIALAVAQLGIGLEIAAKPEEGKREQAAAIVRAASAEAANDPDYVAVRRVSVKISAGVAGYSIDAREDGDGGQIYLPRKWVLKRQLQADKLFATTARGMSMFPRVHEGDTLIVDTSDTRHRTGEVFAINHEGEFTLKRLVRRVNHWWLHSDNPDQTAYPPVMCTDRTITLGKVVLMQAEHL